MEAIESQITVYMTVGSDNKKRGDEILQQISVKSLVTRMPERFY
jgi:hypothetical protein